MSVSGIGSTMSAPATHVAPDGNSAAVEAAEFKKFKRLASQHISASQIASFLIAKQSAVNTGECILHKTLQNIV